MRLFTKIVVVLPVYFELSVYNFVLKMTYQQQLIHTKQSCLEPYWKMGNFSKWIYGYPGIYKPSQAIFGFRFGYFFTRIYTKIQKITVLTTIVYSKDIKFTDFSLLLFHFKICRKFFPVKWYFEFLYTFFVCFRSSWQWLLFLTNNVHNTKSKKMSKKTWLDFSQLL